MLLVVGAAAVVAAAAPAVAPCAAPPAAVTSASDAAHLAIRFILCFAAIDHEPVLAADAAKI